MLADRCARGFKFLPRGFTISGPDAGLIPDPNTTLADSGVYLKPTFRRRCFRLDPVSLDKSIAMEGKNPHMLPSYGLTRCSDLYRYHRTRWEVK